MHYGVLMFPTDYAIAPHELARAAEERGFESVFFPEHTHIPTSRRSPYPAGGELPKEYSHTHDLFVALGAAAAATTKIKIGAGICLVVERDPITTAKEVATVDQLSNGRFIFGIGGGWNAEEMENHGTVFTTRWKLLRERVLAMKEIWTKDEAEFHGEFVDFDPIWSWPKPVQKPHPPILMGGGTNSARQRVVDFCDGWLPIGIAHDVGAGMKDLAERARRRQASRGLPGEHLRRAARPRHVAAVRRARGRARQLLGAAGAARQGAAHPRPVREEHPLTAAARRTAPAVRPSQQHADCARPSRSRRRST
jgi:probable F420-dependent oxidoreductase